MAQRKQSLSMNYQSLILSALLLAPLGAMTAADGTKPANRPSPHPNAVGTLADTGLRALATGSNGVIRIEYFLGNTRILGVPASAPAGVEFRLPGSRPQPEEP